MDRTRLDHGFISHEEFVKMQNSRIGSWNDSPFFAEDMLLSIYSVMVAMHDNDCPLYYYTFCY